MIVHVAVVEYSSNDAEAPDAIIGFNEQTVRRAAAQHLAGLDFGHLYDDAEKYLDGSPLTPVIIADPDKVDYWLAGFQEATTAPWVTFLEEKVLDQ